MELLIYPRLQTDSQKAMKRTKKKWGHSYTYVPRKDLLNRLCHELGMDEDSVIIQIAKEAEYVRKNYVVVRR